MVSILHSVDALNSVCCMLHIAYIGCIDSASKTKENATREFEDVHN